MAPQPALSTDTEPDFSGGAEQRSLAIGLVGAGPTAMSVFERLAANIPELLAARPVTIHLIDPFPIGNGRVWRPDQHPLVWMNSMAEDVTMFTDRSVTCAGPVCPGPSLIEWARSDSTTVAQAIRAEVAALTGTSFPTRRVQTAYLDDFYRHVRATLPASVAVVEHAASCTDLTDVTGASDVTGTGAAGGSGQRLELRYTAGGEGVVIVDVVVLALGHLDVVADAAQLELAAFADSHGLTYRAPGHTAEYDLATIGAGDHVIASGFGQASTDLVVLLTEGRGGSFAADGAGGFVYRPSGAEPIIHLGSRRGVPYRSKPGYRLQAALAPLPTFLDTAAIDALLELPAIDAARDVVPLLVREVGWAYYHELFNAHSDRTTMAWAEFAPLFRSATSNAVRALLVEAAVPDPQDRLDLLALDRPLAGLRFDNAARAHAAIVEHISADLARRTDVAFSADLGAFMAMLMSFGPLARIQAAPQLAARSRLEVLQQWWFLFFMYYASGPPPDRFRQLLALAQAGVVRFIGADTAVVADPTRGRFVATSSCHPDVVVATALIEARLPAPSVARTADALVRTLHGRGEIAEEIVADAATGWFANTGKVEVSSGEFRLVRADGSTHPRRHALGYFTSRPAAGAFARPRTNALAFRQSDSVARAVLATLAARVVC